MSALVSGARRLVGGGRPGAPLGERVAALEGVVTLARGRLDDPLVDRAQAVVSRASGRLALSGEHTVVALAGATGSGKSSTFNALAGVQLAQAGVRRPTTSMTSAVVVGEEADALLDWLGVQRRHQLPLHDLPAVGSVHEAHQLDGLVLLDLPDHDSTEVAHHLEVDRLVQLVDMLVWVLDPQKYADGAIHERYLRPLATHREVMIVALNHIDEVPVGDRGAVLADLRRLLEADGLTGVPVLGTSARHGDGIAELRARIAERVRAKQAAAARLSADVTAAALELRQANGTAEPASLGRDGRARLVEALADAAGVPTVVSAVQRSTLRRGTQATGWPVTAWVRRLRPDPLKRLHLDLGSSGKELTGSARTSMPEPTRVQRARVDTAVREAADELGRGLTRPWSDGLRAASVSRLPDLNDSLDRAVAATDLGADRTPLWWRVGRALQVLFALALVAGLLWLGVLMVLGYLQLPAPSTPQQYGLPAPTLLLVGGIVGGLALAFVARFLNGLVARRRGHAAGRRLRASIGEVADELVVAPMTAELQAYQEVRRGLDAILR